MILKSVIKYANADAIEATWVRRDQLPDIDVPASPALYNEAGDEVVPAAAAHTVPGEVVETVLRCHAYSNHPEQISQLRADLGADSAAHEALIAEVEATYVPPAAPSQSELDAIIAAKIEALWQAADKYTSSYISGVAIGILTIGVMQQKPKALAVSAWSSSVWTEYYVRKALVTSNSADNHDFSSFGPIPYSVPELQAEAGL